MVEFGLKLQDNKVSEWNEYYIQYEKLKGIISKAANAKKKYEELSKKDPELAQRIKEAYMNNYNDATSGEPSASSLITNTETDKMIIKEHQEENNNGEQGGKKNNSSEQVIIAEQEREHASSLPATRVNSSTSLKIDRTMSSENFKAAFGTFVTGYFGNRYERQLRDLLKDFHKANQEFDKCIHAQFKTVNQFYEGKLDDVKQRYSLIVESVMTQQREAEKQLFSSLKEQDYLQGKKRLEESIEEYDLRMMESQNTREDEEGIRKKPVEKLLNQVRESVIRMKNAKLNATANPETSKLLDANSDSFDYYSDDTNNNMKVLKFKIHDGDSIQRSLEDLYRRAKLLHNFAIINYTGFVKIVKKYGKTFREHARQYKLSGTNVCDDKGKAVNAISIDIEKKYASWFSDNNIQQAQVSLLPKQGDILQTDWSQLRLGYRLGMCTILALWLVWDCIWGFIRHGNTTIGGRSAFPVFRACLGLLLLQWFWGFSVFVWTRHRVNYIYLFEFDPRVVAGPMEILNNAVDNTLYFLGCMLLYYKSGVNDIPNLVPPGIFPFILVLHTVMKLVFPLRTRMPMWKAIGAVLTAPMTSPTFFHGYIGDIFTSLVKVFQDIAWTICFIFSGNWLIYEEDASMRSSWSDQVWYKHFLIPLICLLPLWLRFNQCLRKFLDSGKRFPHLANALKYALSSSVTLFGAFHPLYLMHYGVSDDIDSINWFQVFWTTMFVISSCYSFTWDIYVDWGLGRLEYNFLGPKLMYPSYMFYYVVMVLDLVLRFLWVLSLIPPKSGANFEIPQYLTAITLALEIFRRTIWGFLRLENEHRSNASGFRRVDFVPLHFNTGHNHQYNQSKKVHVQGMRVLAEVVAVIVVVVGFCMYSVIVAQHHSKGNPGNVEL